MDKQIKLIYNKKKDKKRELLNIKFTKKILVLITFVYI